MQTRGCRLQVIFLVNIIRLVRLDKEYQSGKDSQTSNSSYSMQWYCKTFLYPCRRIRCGICSHSVCYMAVVISYIPLDLEIGRQRYTSWECKLAV